MRKRYRGQHAQVCREENCLRVIWLVATPHVRKGALYGAIAGLVFILVILAGCRPTPAFEPGEPRPLQSGRQDGPQPVMTVLSAS